MAPTRIRNRLSATELYDPASDSWEERAALPVPRAGMGVAADGESVVVLGGERFTGAQPESFDAVNRYDVATDQWDALTPLPVGRHGLAAAIVDGTLYALSGSTLAGGIDNVERVDTLAL